MERPGQGEECTRIKDTGKESHNEVRMLAEESNGLLGIQVTPLIIRGTTCPWLILTMAPVWVPLGLQGPSLSFLEVRTTRDLGVLFLLLT